MAPHSAELRQRREDRNQALVRPERLPGLQRLLRHPTIAAKALADAAEFSERRAYKIIAGQVPLSVSVLRAWTPVILQASDGVEILEDLYGIREHGAEFRRLASAAPTVGTLAVGVIQLHADMGKVDEDVTEALRDGRITSCEAAEILPGLRAVEQRIHALESNCQAVPQPQLSLSVVTH